MAKKKTATQKLIDKAKKRAEAKLREEAKQLRLKEEENEEKNRLWRIEHRKKADEWVLNNLPAHVYDATIKRLNRVRLQDDIYAEACIAAGLKVEQVHYKAGGSRVEGTDHGPGTDYYLIIE